MLFVCLGNNCRSPLAEGIFRHQVRAAGLAPHFEIATAKERGVEISHQRARHLHPSDLEKHDLGLRVQQRSFSRRSS